LRQLKKILKKISKWVQPRYKLVHLDEQPENLSDGIIYIIGIPSQPWLLTFKCPCGCGYNIYLNLLKDFSPCWRYYILKKGIINIFPSIWRTKGCRSHFFVYKSKIDWY